MLDGSGLPVQNAVVEVKGRSNLCPFRTDQHGEYYRLLLPGNYSFTVNSALLWWLTHTAWRRGQLTDPVLICD